MSELIIKIGLALVGIINFYPLIGVQSNSRLFALYGMPIETIDLSMLLRHRAVMLGIIGALLLISIWQECLRLSAAMAGMISMLSYICLTYSLGISNNNLLRVAWADGLAIVILAVTLVVMLTNKQAA